MDKLPKGSRVIDIGCGIGGSSRILAKDYGFDVLGITISSKQVRRANQLTQKDINLVVPHQASGMAVKAYSKFGGFEEHKVVDIISTTGNCVAASLPLALCTAYYDNRIKDNDLIYLVGTGAGLTIASCLLKI